MNEQIISRFNERVSEDDVTYILGDFCFSITPERAENHLHRLNGYKILVSGNHDQLHHVDIEGWTETHYRLLEIRPGTYGEGFKKLAGNPAFRGCHVTLCHYPMLSWRDSHRGGIHLHGHTHGTLPFDPLVRRLDIGVDSNDFYPWSLEEVMDKLEKVPTPKALREDGTT